MLAKQSVGRACALTIGLLSSLVTAQACNNGGCYALYVNDFNGPCGVDPSDPSLYGYYANWCDCGGGLTATMTYTQTDGAVITTAVSTAGGGGTTDAYFTFPFNVPHTALASGSYVGHQLAVGGAYYPSVSSVTSPVQSIFFAESTQVITSTVTSPTTSTSTNTVTSTTTLAQSTTTSPCTTGTTTQTAASVTSTITSTITFPTFTITIPKVITSTTTVACVSATAKRAARRAGLLDARQNGAVYETDYCPNASGPPTPTTIYTDTEYDTVTTTVTTTLTSSTDVTVTTTATPNPATTTVCSNVLGTTTVTPTKTRTSYRYSLPLPTTVTKTYTKIKTKFAGGKPALCTVAPKPNRPPPAGAQCLTLSSKK